LHLTGLILIRRSRVGAAPRARPVIV